MKEMKQTRIFLVEKNRVKKWNRKAKPANEFWNLLFWEGEHKESLLLLGDMDNIEKSIADFLIKVFEKQGLTVPDWDPDGIAIYFFDLKKEVPKIIWDIPKPKKETPKEIRSMILSALEMKG